jgi:tetratricopeptide (TPR) repeat protein
LYTAKDVAQIVGIPESRVRYWAQTGFVGPSGKSGGRAVYSFPDLVSVRAAKELLDRGVSLQRARKNLEALRSQLPGIDRPLAQLRVRSDGERVLVADGAGAFEPLSGQLVMDFALEELAGEVAALTAPEPPPERKRAPSAYAWFLEGGACETNGDDDAALIAYQKAIDGDPALAAAHTNMGGLLQRRGELGQAREHYERALALDPDQPEARYNLGNLLDDVGEHAQARMEWYRVLAVCPEFADAHFNLAVAFARDGDAASARSHLDRYLTLAPDDPRALELYAKL